MKKFNITILIVIFSVSVIAQITESTSTGRNNSKPDQAEKAEARIRQVTKDSGRYFNQGLLNLQDNRHSQAREDFDKSVEVFLISGINIQSSKELRECYNQLIETVYRMEFPADQKPVNIKGLSAVCSWSIKEDLADKVSNLVKTNPNKVSTDENSNDKSLIASAANSGTRDDFNPVGFTEQKYEPSPLDELSKLEINEEELNINLNTSIIIKNPLPAGTEPVFNNGKVQSIIKYIYDTFHNPYTVKYLNWSKPYLIQIGDKLYWTVSVKLRAKNLFNAYVLQVINFYIQNGKVIFASERNLGRYYNNDTRTNYSRPTTTQSMKVVKAKSGDTVTTVAQRHGANPVEVAKFNGLLPTSKLNAGREIRIPVN
jgi:LysM repeat protein